MADTSNQTKHQFSDYLCDTLTNFPTGLTPPTILYENKLTQNELTILDLENSGTQVIGKFKFNKYTPIQPELEKIDIISAKTLTKHNQKF